MPIPQAGTVAPDFDLSTSGGGRLQLSDLRGKRVVLWFYPKDDTPGCTIEAQGFRDKHDEVSQTGAVVLGISGDDVASHDAWIGKLGIPFTLVADPDHKAIDAYGVWGEREFNGNKYMGILRTTFLIGADGVVERVWEGVTPTGHADQVLEALRS